MEGFNKIKRKKISKLRPNSNVISFQSQDNDVGLSGQWIKSLNLTNQEKLYLTRGEEICDRLIDASLNLVQKKCPYFEFQSVCLGAEHLIYPTIQLSNIHHTGSNHFVTTTSIGGWHQSIYRKVRIFDSLNLPPTRNLMKEIISIYSPDPSVLPTVIQMNMASTQQGSYDSGHLALAYALELALNKDPSTLIFDQTKMRGHFLSCLEKEEAEQFPKLRRSLHPATQIEITKLVRDTNKWSYPKQFNKQTCPYEPEGISIQNRFAPLNNEIFGKNIRK